MALTFIPDANPDRAETPNMARPSDEERAQWIAEYLHGKHCVRLTIPLFNVTQLRETMRALRGLADELQTIYDDKETANGWKVIWGRNSIQRLNRVLKGGEHYKGAR